MQIRYLCLSHFYAFKYRILNFYFNKFERIAVMDQFETLLSMMPDRVSNDNIFTPVNIAKDMVDMLPNEVWNSSSKFLDIACKSGIFLYEIYKKLMDSPSVIRDFPNKQERRKHIVNNQLYGIATSQLCRLISIRSVYGRLVDTDNILYIERFPEKIKTYTFDRLKTILEKGFNTEMKFDVVIGNPPYNRGGGPRLRRFRI